MKTIREKQINNFRVHCVFVKSIFQKATSTLDTIKSERKVQITMLQWLQLFGLGIAAMTNHHCLLHIVASGLRLVGVFLLITFWAGPLAAQSGRRAPKSSSPAATPTPQAEPIQEKPAAETRADLSFVVGIDQVSTSGYIPMYFHDSVLRACGDRLDDSPSVKVTVANREMNRAEAIKRAKAETESHIVWLQLRFDGTRNDEDLREVYIDYWVFAPTTAKVVTNGRSYQQIARAGGVIMMPSPGGRASMPYTEQLLRQAARDAAERILSAMNVSGRRVPG